MPSTITASNDLQQQIDQLEAELARLKAKLQATNQQRSVTVPAPMQPLFDHAEATVREYFKGFKMDPTKGTIEINDQRYVLVRASAFSKGFLETIQRLYADKGETEAFAIGRNFLFDYAHVIGLHDARDFHERMHVTDPIAKLSAGPIHFAWSGWAFVDISPDSTPTPDENFCLIYDHPYSFEAESWKRAGKLSKEPVCVMNAGYSSGWCEQSFGIELTAVEVSCTARGDDRCTFIMAPPHKMPEQLARFNASQEKPFAASTHHAIPTFFERKKVEEEMERSRQLAEESARAKSDFVANMSHELRTPLGAILGFTDLLHKTPLNNEQQDYIDAIHTSGKSLLAIINDILDLSKLDAGKFQTEIIPFSIPELMHSLQVMFAAKAGSKDLRLSCSVDMGISFPVLGDPMRLTQVLVNLMGNAVKFTEAGGVYVNCLIHRETEETAELSFTVRDTGIGIPADKIDHIFDRFTQVDSRITRQYGGTGLGLSITKQLVELLGGQITITSRIGVGTECQFTLPYRKAHEQHQPTVRETSEQRAYYELKKILIVEDNLMNQKLTSIILRNQGFEVMVARNGRKAVDYLREHPADLILMDIQMPVMDGYKTTQLIRQELRLTTPIIAMTAHALSGERDKCLQAGMNDYLAKPFREPDLLDKIASWAREQHSQQGASMEPPTLPRIDLSFLTQQTRNNKAFIREMIAVFLKQNPREVAKLHSSLEKADYKAVYKTAHSLRNTIGFFGLTPAIGNELLTIEQLAIGGEEVHRIGALVNKVSAVCKQAVKDLKEVEL
ncbi:response regulator [Paraflavitalea pollutisoli]|uniref:response regulator n=1 Tax=Paraflavitalea pollutisoli TaxID=3034143 RepID=UPI0023EC9DAD|nr:response regulator [Paraflavitalea sp. H1-2-19X]